MNYCGQIANLHHQRENFLFIRLLLSSSPSFVAIQDSADWFRRRDRMSLTAYAYEYTRTLFVGLFLSWLQVIDLLTHFLFFSVRSMDQSAVSYYTSLHRIYEYYHYRVSAIEITIIGMEYSLHLFAFDVNEVHVYW